LSETKISGIPNTARTEFNAQIVVAVDASLAGKFQTNLVKASTQTREYVFLDLDRGNLPTKSINNFCMGRVATSEDNMS
jgi:hypothetical protein